MGLANVGEKTLFFKHVEGCMCSGGCMKKVRKLLRQIHGIVSIDYNEDEEKLTIQGSNVDPNMVIRELGTIGKTFELVTEDYPSLDEIEEKQTIVHQTDVISVEASSVVLYNQVGNLPGLSMITPGLHFRPEHNHELELKDYDKRFTCDGCKEEGFKKRYRCKHCDYELHEDCMHPKPTISHELFEGSVFKFCDKKPTCGILCKVHTKSCEACGNGIHGYSYHCEAKGLYLHPMCVNFGGKICIEGETFALKNKGPFECFWCNSPKKTESGWSYVSESTECQLHVNCVAKIAHEAWKEQDIGGGNDAYIMVLKKRLNLGLVKNNKRSEWSKGGKLVKMILVFARTIIGILLGDPTVILASMLVEIIK